MEVEPLSLHSFSAPPPVIGQAAAVAAPVTRSFPAGDPKESQTDDAVVVHLSRRVSPITPVSSGATTETTDNTTARSETLTEEEQREVEELQARDREVRAHEQAHKSRLGPYAQGGAQYQYTIGPDGRRYAIAGEVAVDLAAEEDPQKTIEKMRTIRQAANALADPSAADRQVAAQAQAFENAARRDLQRDEGSADNSNTAKEESERSIPPTSAHRSKIESYQSASQPEILGNLNFATVA